ncbi:MAG: HAMP domain-containing sensor histidine kinase, partial [Acidobacteriota bacterium]
GCTRGRLAAMAALLPHVELLLFLAGTVVYGFLVRELVRHPDVLPRLWTLRALAAALLLWYGGTLFDQWLVFLMGAMDGPSLVGASLDVARALGWLLAPPLLLHTLAGLHAGKGGLRWPWRLPVAAGYLGLLLFVEPIRTVLESRSPYLVESASTSYPLLVLHAAVCFLPAAWAAWLQARRLGAARLRMVRFLRALARLLVALVALIALGLVTGDVWSPEPSLLGAGLRLLILGAMLLPGVLFAYFVQRYNLLRLSLSNRFLRRFGGVLALVVMAMLAGPVLGIPDDSVLRPLIAWGLVLTLLWSVFSSVALERLIERSATWRVFLGRAVTTPKLEALLERLESLGGDDEELMRETAGSISEWLGCDAQFVPRTLATEGLWRAADVARVDAAHRLAKLPPDLIRELDRHDLQAVFTLRVGGALRAILGLSASVTGGGHGHEELEGISLLLRQLESSLRLRELSRRRLSEERRAAEQERLGLLGLVSASLAHEIKNPLSSIKILAQAMREDALADDPGGEAVHDLDAILDQIDRLGATTREMLSFARPRRGETTELSSLLDSAVYILRAEARKRSVEIRADVESPVDVVGSPAAWQTIAFNLLRNAVDHAPGQGEVRVRLGSLDEPHPAGGVELEVSNPGSLDGEARRRLFEPFVSGSGSFGLGLSLVARRVDEVGARISVRESDGRVRFRVAAEAAPDPDAPTRESPEVSPEMSPETSPEVFPEILPEME